MRGWSCQAFSCRAVPNRRRGDRSEFHPSSRGCLKFKSSSASSVCCVEGATIKPAVYHKLHLHVGRARTIGFCPENSCHTQNISRQRSSLGWTEGVAVPQCAGARRTSLALLMGHTKW